MQKSNNFGVKFREKTGFLSFHPNIGRRFYSPKKAFQHKEGEGVTYFETTGPKALVPDRGGRGQSRGVKKFPNLGDLIYKCPFIG